MRALAPWAALLVFGGGSWSGTSASAQSLAEVAEKEKQRRSRSADTEQTDPIPVIGDEELESSRGDRLSVMGRERTEADPAQQGEGAEDAQTNTRLTKAEIQKYRETWARIWPERLAAAEKELELAKDAVFQCQSAAHYVFVPLAVDCSGVFERRAIAEYRVREIRENRFNWELLLPERQRPPPPR